MPKFQCEVIEEVTATISLEVEAENAEEAAKLARHAWVTNGEGSLSEAVNDRWVEVNGEHVETSAEDE